MVFGFLFLVHFSSINSVQEINNYDIFSQNLNPESNKIFLLGSSHIGHINSTFIIESVSKKNESYEVYNLAINSDSPKTRFNSIQDIISLNPKIIFYGISYRDFESTTILDSKSILPDIKLIVENSIPEELETINPQLITRRTIRDLLNYYGIVSTQAYDIHPPNTPFFSLGSLQTLILDKDDLQRKTLTVLPSPEDLYIKPSNNQQVQFFKKIIQELQANQIKVVIFTTPIHEIYLAEMPPESKIAFNQILNEISNGFDIEIYDFIEKYSDLDVWNNLDHIAYNENSMVFTYDVTEMIVLEIDT